MTRAESLLLSVLAVLWLFRLSEYSISNETLRIISSSAIVGVYWMLVIIAGNEAIAWVIADIF